MTPDNESPDEIAEELRVMFRDLKVETLTRERVNQTFINFQGTEGKKPHRKIGRIAISSLASAAAIAAVFIFVTSQERTVADNFTLLLQINDAQSEQVAKETIVTLSEIESSTALRTANNDSYLIDGIFWAFTDDPNMEEDPIMTSLVESPEGQDQWTEWPGIEINDDGTLAVPARPNKLGTTSMPNDLARNLPTESETLFKNLVDRQACEPSIKCFMNSLSEFTRHSYIPPDVQNALWVTIGGFEDVRVVENAKDRLNRSVVAFVVPDPDSRYTFLVLGSPDSGRILGVEYLSKTNRWLIGSTWRTVSFSYLYNIEPHNK